MPRKLGEGSPAVHGAGAGGPSPPAHGSREEPLGVTFARHVSGGPSCRRAPRAPHCLGDRGRLRAYFDVTAIASVLLAGFESVCGDVKAMLALFTIGRGVLGAVTVSEIVADWPFWLILSATWHVTV